MLRGVGTLLDVELVVLLELVLLPLGVVVSVERVLVLLLGMLVLVLVPLLEL